MVRKRLLPPSNMHRIMTRARVAKASDNQRHEDLTEREMEVLHCIAAGLSNMEIALRLAISEKIAKSHVSNILSKLYLTDRTQAAVMLGARGLRWGRTKKHAMAEVVSKSHPTFGQFALNSTEVAAA